MSKVAVISSFSNFMSASAGPLSNGTGTAYGLQASITEVPAGYTLSYIVSAANNGDGASAGVNEAFEAWGDKLLKTYGKSRDVTYKDFSLNYLGYSTDNGAFYYYQTEDHQPGKRGYVRVAQRAAAAAAGQRRHLHPRWRRRSRGTKMF